MAANGLDASPISEILIERSIAGWKEYELEVMRDRADNCVVICSIENLDPMGVHTGDSITVAPAQTLTDVEYQAMRDAAFACIRRVGVETGGSNVQFALDPTNGDMVIIEMNPRVSRSSALASKATGFPIAKIAAKLAVGYTLDEIPNDITRKTPASFEPTIDYVVTKVPRWAFEKFPGSAGVLGTSMQSVGEAMAIGRTFPESLQKALRCLEHGRAGPELRPGRGRSSTASTTTSWSPGPPSARPTARSSSRPRCAGASRSTRSPSGPGSTRGSSTRSCASSRSASHLADIGLGRHDPARRGGGPSSSASATPSWPGCGAVDRRRRCAPPGSPPGCGPRSRPSTPAAPSSRPTTPYHYSTYEDEDEVAPSERRKVLILGLGPQPHRPGHRVRLLLRPRQLRPGRRRLRDGHAQLQPRDGLDRLRHVRPPLLRAAHPRGRAQRHRGRAGRGRAGGRGRGPRRADAAEAGRRRCPRAWCSARRRRRSTRPRTASVERPVRPPRDPPAGRRHGHHVDEALAIVGRIGYPALLRPSYVLGGRAMEIVYDDEGLRRAMAELAGFGSLGTRAGCRPTRPVLIDRFLEDATEVDVDAIRDHTGEVVIGGVMEHVEEAGVHSGDSACSIPPHSLAPTPSAVIEDYTRRLADALDVRGPHQRAVRGQAGPGLRHRGQPPGQPHRAVRGQGHRACRW